MKLHGNVPFLFEIIIEHIFLIDPFTRVPQFSNLKNLNLAIHRRVVPTRYHYFHWTQYVPICVCVLRNRVTNGTLIIIFIIMVKGPLFVPFSWILGPTIKPSSYLGNEFIAN
jgi:hypothetical protein